MTGDAAIESLETRLFLNAIHERYGYDFRGYEEATMQRRVRAAVARLGCDHLGELQHRVLVDPTLFFTVLDDLTIHVSDMFRDPLFFQAFREEIVPQLHPYPQIRVWLAGCANGEEVYSMAILLHEEGLRDRVQLYATDLSHQALEEAKAGVYALSKFEKYLDNYRRAGGKGPFEDYFTRAYERIAVKSSLRNSVTFFQHDLVSDYALGETQVILCRNVMIYFGEELRSRVVQKFADSLCVGGFLCLGSSESLGVNHGPFVGYSLFHRIYRRGSLP